MKYPKDPATYKPEFNIPDRVAVPDNTIYALTNEKTANPLLSELIVPLNGIKSRHWFNQHIHFCLPLTMGSQYGFIVKMLQDTIIRWNGGPDNSDMDVYPKQRNRWQVVESHFGMGILTIQNLWTYRTPENVNLYVSQPPNFPHHGLHFLSAVIECDNLRRDFTFNIKVTKPNMDIFIPAGTPIGWFMPYPRHYIDLFEVKPHPEGDVLENERLTMKEFGKIRDSTGGWPDHMYMSGQDAYGNKFEDHQKSLAKCPYMHGAKVSEPES